MAGDEVGNDVVDLLDPDTDPGRDRDRFDARVCGETERRALGEAADPSRVRWALWAAKEAGYKLLRKRCPDTVFSPVRFEVALDPAWVRAARPDAVSCRGGVVHGPHRLDVSIAVQDHALHAVASWPGADGGTLVVGQLRLAARDADASTPAGHSRAVRALATDRLAGALGVAPGRLSIVKRDRIPELLLDGAPAGADLSLSHHGRVVAFACRLRAAHRAARLAS